MTENPDFHGLYERRHSGNEEVNYLASYRFMIKIETNTERKNIYICIESRYSRINRYKLVKNPFNDGESTKRRAFSKIIAMQIKKRLYLEWQCILQQILLHIQPIVITMEQRYSITHAINEKKKVSIRKMRQTILSLYPERFDMAYRAERNTLYRYQGKRSDVAGMS
ncbi:MAG: hypothetical protein ACLS54_13190 [Anaerostipes hadrus]